MAFSKIYDILYIDYVTLGGVLLNKHNNQTNSSNNNLDKTKKFSLDDIDRSLNCNTQGADQSDNTVSPHTGHSDLPLENTSGFSSGPERDIFEEIFDSQKRATASFDETLDKDFTESFSSFSSDPVQKTEESEAVAAEEPMVNKTASEGQGNTKIGALLHKYNPFANKEKMKNFFRSNAWFVIKTLLLVFACTLTICAITLIGYMISLDDEINIEIEALRLNYSSIVYYVDEDGAEHEYERLYATQNRTWVNLEDMPKHLQNAAIAIEDHRFREHSGVDWKRTFGACFNMFFKTKSDFGASTITQQLVKNLTGDNQDSVKRKLQEIMRARYLEKHYDKDTILELYLNTIFLGEGCYGVGTAARTYFGKDVSELSIAESAAIIGITNLPTYYNPYLHPDNNRKRCDNIINRMYELNMISAKERDAALNEELVFKRGSKDDNSDTVQSYFVDQIIEDLLVDLTEECGYSKTVALHMIYSGGLKIYSTVNPELQSSMDEIFENDSNFRKYQSSTQPECAMVLMDPQNGNVVALRGGRGNKTAARVLNRATQTKRPPGSTIKPISVYAPAIEYGLITPSSPEDDAPIIFFNGEDAKKASGVTSSDNVSVAINSGQSGKLYPNNEDHTFSGRTNILEGVKKSLNTISMRTLIKLGIDKSYNFLSANLGVTSLSPKNDKNLAPLALGQLDTGITVLEMAAAYVPFANGGTYYKPRLYTKVLDSNGNVLIDRESKPIKAMSKKTVTYMSYMLQKVVTEGTGTKAKLAKGMPAAAKTGTSTGNHDRWFVGYTPYYVGATWFGYDIPASLGPTLSQALTTWKKVMDSAHSNLPVKNFEKNEDFRYVNVCAKSGLLPTEHCNADPRGTQVIAGYFHKDDIPTASCNVHASLVIDKETNMPVSEFCPEENKITVIGMKLNRYHNVILKEGASILLGDEQYVFHSGTLPVDMFRFSGSGGSAINTSETCSLHTSAPPPPSSSESDISPEEDDVIEKDASEEDDTSSENPTAETPIPEEPSPETNPETPLNTGGSEAPANQS